MKIMKHYYLRDNNKDTICTNNNSNNYFIYTYIQPSVYYMEVLTTPDTQHLLPTHWVSGIVTSILLFSYSIYHVLVHRLQLLMCLIRKRNA